MAEKVGITPQAVNPVESSAQEENASLLAAPELAVSPSAQRPSSPAMPEPQPLIRIPLKEVDPDRWLASRFAPAVTRGQLETLYGFVFEVARTAEAVSEPQLGLIRLAWWREALEQGAGAADPLARGMRALIEETPLDPALLHEMIEARSKDFMDVPFEGWADLEHYVDATAGATVHLALQICLAGQAWPKQAAECARAVGRAWGFTGLVRAEALWRGRRRTFYPRRLLEHLRLTPAKAIEGGAEHVNRQANLAMLDRARFAFSQAQDLARVMPTAAFPALGYLALEPGYREPLQLGESKTNRSLLGRQLTLVKASALGRY
jgi:phytoene synthase